MKRAMLMIMVVFVVASAAMMARGAEPIVAKEAMLLGEWNGAVKIDEAAIEKQMKKEKPTATAEEIDIQVGILKGFLGDLKMDMKFEMDGVASITMTVLEKPETKKGKWSVTASSGATLKVKMVVDGEKAEEDASFTFKDNDTVEMSAIGKDKLPAGVSLVFKRKK